MRHVTIISKQHKVISQILADNNFKMLADHPDGPRVLNMSRVDGKMTAGDREHFGDLVDLWLEGANYLRALSYQQWVQGITT